MGLSPSVEGKTNFIAFGDVSSLLPWVGRADLDYGRRNAADRDRDEKVFYVQTCALVLLSRLQAEVTSLVRELT